MRHGLWRFSFINLMLFLFNIRPIPPLDGGFICLQAYGIVTWRKIPKNIELAIVSIGALLVIAFLSAWAIWCIRPITVPPQRTTGLRYSAFTTVKMTQSANPYTLQFQIYCTFCKSGPRKAWDAVCTGEWVSSEITSSRWFQTKLSKNTAFAASFLIVF